MPLLGPLKLNRHPGRLLGHLWNQIFMQLQKESLKKFITVNMARAFELGKWKQWARRFIGLSWNLYIVKRWDCKQSVLFLLIKVFLNLTMLLCNMLTGICCDLNSMDVHRISYISMANRNNFIVNFNYSYIRVLQDFKTRWSKWEMMMVWILASLRFWDSNSEQVRNYVKCILVSKQRRK